MGLIRAYRNAPERRGANPYAPFGNTVPPTNGQLGNPASGGSMSEGAALGIGAVFTAVTILSDAIATLPLKQYRGLGTKKTEIALSPVIAQPYVEITQLDWISQMQMSLGLRGNAYALIIERDARGMASQIMPVHPDKVSIRRNSGQLVYRIDNIDYPQDDVFHIRGYSVPGSPVGLSPIDICRSAFGIAKSADDYYRAFFYNSAQPGGILRVPGDLDSEEARDLANQWMQSHQGIGASHVPAVLSGGIEWQSITLSPRDIEFIESRQFSREEIASIYRIPLYMMGIQGASKMGVGIEQDELSFTRNTLQGWLRRHELALSSLLPTGQYVRFDLSERLRGDVLTRYRVYQIARNNGIMPPSEIRTMEDLPPLSDEYSAWADNPMAPLNSAQNGTLTAPGVETPLPIA